jgi:hypothetical protein
MLILVAGVAAVAVVALLVKYHTVAAATAAVKAEVAKIETEYTTEEAVVKAKVLAVVARIKALI